jgi:biotin transport system permease protein
MTALFGPNTSPIHLAAPGPKLLALIVLILAVSWSPLAGLALTAALFALAYKGLTQFFKHLWALKILIALITIPQLLFGTPWATVLDSTVRITVAMLLATLFSLTTKTQALLDSIERALHSRPLSPLTRFGLKPETVSLAFAMTMNAIPMIMKFVGQIKEAQSARGLKATPVRMTIPLLVASLKYSDEFAEALTARGVEV